MVSTQDIKLGLAVDKLKQPLHAKVRQILREQILQNFEHGQKFYTERELIQKLSVSQVTVRRAVQDLVGEGFLQTDPRRGLFVQRHKNVRCVGLVAPAGAEHLEPEYIALCRQHGYILNVHTFQKDDSVEHIMSLICCKPSEERVILEGLSVEQTLELGSRLQAQGYQHIVVGARQVGFTGGSLSVNHECEVNLVLDYLTDLGHERICFLANEPHHELTTRRRAEAVKTSLQRRNLSHAQLIYCNGADAFDCAYRKTGEVLTATPAPTVIVSLFGAGAWAVQRYAIEHQIKVPTELSILSFESMANSAILPIPLTELIFSREELALSALNLLWSDRASIAHELFTPRLQVRQSTAVPMKQTSSSAGSMHT